MFFGFLGSRADRRRTWMVRGTLLVRLRWLRKSWLGKGDKGPDGSREWSLEEPDRGWMLEDPASPAPGPDPTLEQISDGLKQSKLLLLLGAP